METVPAETTASGKSGERPYPELASWERTDRDTIVATPVSVVSRGADSVHRSFSGIEPWRTIIVSTTPLDERSEDTEYARRRASGSGCGVGHIPSSHECGLPHARVRSYRARTVRGEILERSAANRATRRFRRSLFELPFTYRSPGMETFHALSLLAAFWVTAEDTSSEVRGVDVLWETSTPVSRRPE